MKAIPVMIIIYLPLYYINVDIDNELATIIIKIDPNAQWVYNKHCRHCGKFLYIEEINTKCKKCGSKTTLPILRPIPFNNSATAIEKLITWIKDWNQKNIQNDKYSTLLLNIKNIYIQWILDINQTPENYRQKIIEKTIQILYDTI